MKEWLKILIPILLIAPVGWLLRKYWDEVVTIVKRLKLKIFPTNFNIGLSFDYVKGEKSYDYFTEIRKQLNNIIDDNNLSDQIKIYDFSKEIQFINKLEAQEFCKKKGVDLIVWGNFSNKNLKTEGEEIYSLRVNFTFVHPTDKDNKIGKLLLLDISSKMAHKNYWKILDGSSYEDTLRITNNIFDIGSYIIARVFQLYGKLFAAATILERIYFKNKDDLTFQNNLRPHIIDVYVPLIIDLILINKNFNSVEQYCKKMLKINPNDFFGLSNLAISQYKLGEESLSELTVNKLLEIYPNNPLTHANVAFFRLLQKNYTNAIKHYKKLIKYHPEQLKFNPLEIVEFLSYEYERRKDPAFLFASGIISYHFGDNKLGKEDLVSFLGLAKNQQEYKQMYRWAKQLID